LARLDEIQAMLDAATPGPWHWDCGQLVHEPTDVSDPWNHTEVVTNEPGINKPSMPDARLIAACPQLIQALLDVARVADWIALLDMDPEDHKSYRKFRRLQDALSRLKQLELKCK